MDRAVVILKRNIEALMGLRKMTQADLAGALGRSQGWLSKRLAGPPKGTRWTVDDLDSLAAFFGLPVTRLFWESGLGGLERRIGRDRRRGEDRRHTTTHVRATAADRFDALPQRARPDPPVLRCLPPPAGE